MDISWRQFSDVGQLGSVQTPTHDARANNTVVMYLHCGLSVFDMECGSLLPI